MMNRLSVRTAVEKYMGREKQRNRPRGAGSSHPAFIPEGQPVVPILVGIVACPNNSESGGGLAGDSRSPVR